MGPTVDGCLHPLPPGKRPTIIPAAQLHDGLSEIGASTNHDKIERVRSVLNVSWPARERISFSVLIGRYRQQDAG